MIFCRLHSLVPLERDIHISSEIIQKLGLVEIQFSIFSFSEAKRLVLMYRVWPQVLIVTDRTVTHGAHLMFQSFCFVLFWTIDYSGKDRLWSQRGWENRCGLRCNLDEALWDKSGALMTWCGAEAELGSWRESLCDNACLNQLQFLAENETHR